MRLLYELKHPFDNGTTHFIFEPLEFLAKLAALVPRPRANLTRYHGLLAPSHSDGPPSAKYRHLVVPAPNRRAKRKRKHTAHTESEPRLDTDRETDRPLAPLSWAERLKRVCK
ncbi:MAG: hypothetical protein E2O59_01900 [Gammaproteobacteria bacterium]|nr:MAG: hypothetical protein E2O59_01900 [Gammaproteobacteria bacterium]